jgi:hypothetical protein
MTKPSTEDGIIKNPARGNVQYEDMSFYIPAHVRHGITPIPQDFSAIDGELIDTNIDSQENDYTVDEQSVKKKAPEVGDLVLMVHGKVILHGKHKDVLEETKSILYGEHPKFLGQNIKAEDVVIMKRIGLKVGVFLDG